LLPKLKKAKKSKFAICLLKSVNYRITAKFAVKRDFGPKYMIIIPGAVLCHWLIPFKSPFGKGGLRGILKKY
jgi:hypothetical protein